MHKGYKDQEKRKAYLKQWRIKNIQSVRDRFKNWYENGGKAWVTEYRKSHVRFVNVEKARVRDATNWAIKSGKLKRLPCEICGEIDAEAHHPDYDKPLDVKWLCRKHHMELHREY